MYEKYERKIELNKRLNELKIELFWCKYKEVLNELNKKNEELNNLNDKRKN